MKTYKMFCGVDCIATTIEARNLRSAMNKCLKWAKKGDWSECDIGDKITYKVVNVADPAERDQNYFTINFTIKRSKKK